MVYRAPFVLAACLLPYAVSFGASDAFSGQWAHYSCESRHTVHFTITVTGSSVVGEWTDGNIRTVLGGQLRGELKGDRLIVRLCEDSSHEKPTLARCPDYEKTPVVLAKSRNGLDYRKEGLPRGRLQEDLREALEHSAEPRQPRLGPLSKSLCKMWGADAGSF